MRFACHGGVFTCGQEPSPDKAGAHKYLCPMSVQSVHATSNPLLTIGSGLEKGFHYREVTRTRSTMLRTRFESVRISVETNNTSIIGHTSSIGYGLHTDCILVV